MLLGVVVVVVYVGLAGGRYIGPGVDECAGKYSLDGRIASYPENSIGLPGSLP